MQVVRCFYGARCEAVAWSTHGGQGEIIAIFNINKLTLPNSASANGKSKLKFA